MEEDRDALHPSRDSADRVAARGCWHIHDWSIRPRASCAGARAVYHRALHWADDRTTHLVNDDTLAGSSTYDSLTGGAGGRDASYCVPSVRRLSPPRVRRRCSAVALTTFYLRRAQPR